MYSTKFLKEPAFFCYLYQNDTLAHGLEDVSNFPDIDKF